MSKEDSRWYNNLQWPNNPWIALIVVYALVVSGCILGIVLDKAFEGRKIAFTLTADVSLFAMFYVVTQAIERFLEPIAGVLGAQGKEKALQTKENAEINVFRLASLSQVPVSGSQEKGLGKAVNDKKTAEAKMRFITTSRASSSRESRHLSPSWSVYI